MKNNSLWQIIKKYRWNSIFAKYAINLCIFVVLPITILCFFFFYQSYRLASESQINAHHSYLNEKISLQFENLLNTVYSGQTLLTANPSLHNYFFRIYHDENEMAINVKYISNNLKSILNASQYIGSIYILNKRENYILSDQTNADMDHFFDMDWYSLYLSNNSQNYIKYRTVNVNNQEKQYITLCISADIYQFYGGVIVYNIDCGKLSDMFDTAEGPVKEIYLTDQNNTIVFSNIKNKINTLFPPDNLDEKHTITTNLNQFSLITVCRNDYYNQLIPYRSLIIFFAAILLALLFIVTYVLSKRFYCSLVNIINIFQGNTLSASDSILKDEFQYISKNITEMLKKNRDIENELAVQYNQLKNTQTLALQNQINPHFIFNVLNTIALLDISQNKKSTQISEMIGLLSGILRSAINSKEYVVALRKEVDYVNKYILLQNIKYKNNIEVILNIGDNTKDIPVVKFMLQPIVENALVHGILADPCKKGILEIKSTAENDLLKITVQNSGKILDKSKLHELKSDLKANRFPDGEHIGLLNVNSRIKLIFGDQYGCDIESDASGTMVEYTLPFHIND